MIFFRRISLLSLAALLCLASPDPFRGGFSSALRRVPAALTPALLRTAGVGHSHNDYEQEQPLSDALRNGFYSVEADIWLVNHEILISHLGWFFTGALKELYLDPLQARVDRLGSV